MISANDLVNTCLIPLREKAGYIWGAYGQVHTQADQNRATREQTIKWGQQWVGKRCWDCSGLIYWAFKQYGETIYHGSNTIWNSYCSAKGKLYNGSRVDNEPLKIGTAVFLYRASDNCRHHVGLYIGNGRCVEAKGTYNGVVESDISHWDEWGELKDVDYSGKVVIDTESLRIGMKGKDVEQLQENLNRLGYSCGKVDGIFGAGTRSAVMAFQQKFSLTVDGIAGSKTLAAIDAEIKGSDGGKEIDKQLIAEAINAAQNAEKAARMAVELLQKILNEGDDGK